MAEDKALLRQFWRLIDEHFKGQPAFEAWLGLWRDDGVYEQAFPAAGKPVRCVGKDEIRAFVSPMVTVFRDFAFTEPEIWATDDPALYVVRTNSTGVVVATGRQYVQHYLWLFRVRDGKIAHWIAYLNPLEVLKAFAPRQGA